MRAQNELYIGPSGSGKSAALSRYLLEEAYKNPDKNYLLIVPDQSASAFEKRLLRLNSELFGISGLLNVDILGMSRLAFRIFEEYDVPSGRVLEEFERSMMVRAACSKVADLMKVYGGSIDKKGFISQAKSLISELMQYGIEIGDLDKLIEKLKMDGVDSLAGKLHDIRLIYKEITERFFQDIGMGLPEERMKVLVACLKDTSISSVVDGSVLAFDEFRGFTPDQFDIIAALENRAEKMIFTLTMDTDIVKKKTEVKEHELYYQSYSTCQSLYEIFGLAPVIKYYERGTDITRFGKDSGIAHLERSIFRFPIREFKGHPYDVEIWRTDDQVSELSVVAEDILQKVKAGARFRDFAVVTGDMAGLSAYADGIFGNYGIPVFIDESRSFGKNPFTEALIKLLQIIDKDFNYDSVFGFVKLGLTGDDITGALDVLENYCLRYGIRGKKIWEKKIEFSSEDLPRELKDEITDDFQSSEKAREAVMDLLAPMLEINRTKSTVSEITGALRCMIAPDKLNFEGKIADTVKMYEKLGKPAEANAMNSLYEKILTVFDSMEEIIGTEEISVHDYLEVLSMGIEDMKLGVIPPTLDAVVVADCERSRLDRVKTVYFINMNDGILPAVSNNSKLLSDKDKDRITEIFRELGIKKILAPTDRVQSYVEQFFIYQMLTRPEERLVLSYADLNRGGTSMEISYILGRIKRIFPDVEEVRKHPELFKGTKATDVYGFTESVRTAMEMICDRNAESIDEDAEFGKLIDNIALFRKLDPDTFVIDKDAVLYSNKPEKLPQEIMKNLKVEISVSKLEKYASCPYSFFLRYILKLNPREEKKLDYLDVGTILHRTLELTGITVKEEHDNDWKGIDVATLYDISEKALKTALSENEFFSAEAESGKSKTDVVCEELTDIMKRTVDTLKFQIGKGIMLPDAFEQKFTATFRASRPDGEEIPVTINGTIDRLDTLRDDSNLLFRIIDYKTGAKTFDPKQVEAGVNLQLTVYTDIIREIFKREYSDATIIPAGMYYYHVANPDVSDISAAALKEAGGDEEAAAVTEQRKLLRLKGAVNIDDPEHHRVALVQEAGVFDAEGAATKGTVVPIDKGRGSEEYSKDTAAAGTDELEKMGILARNRMVEITEQILDGDISKSPVKYGKSGKTSCEYCDYSGICRFGLNSGKHNYLSDDGRSARDKISDMTQDVCERIKYDRVERITTKGSGKSE